MRAANAVGGTGGPSRLEYANYLRDQSFLSNLFGQGMGGKKKEGNTLNSDLIANPNNKRTFIGGSRANL